MTKIAIISTSAGCIWGGSEYLWAATAKQALSDRHEVFISISDWSLQYPLVTQLQKQGACVSPRPSLVKASLPSRVMRKVNRIIPFFNTYFSKSLYQPAFDWKPDVICVSQTSSYDIAYTPDLFHLLTSSSIPYIVICQFNSDILAAVDSFARSTAQQIFNQAARVAFVCDHNLKLAQRQLAQSLPNAIVVQNPVNMSDRSLVPFPPQSVVSFACVARLETAFKAQEVLFEALSSPIWRERNWLCNLYGDGIDRAYLEALARYYNIGDRIMFMGHVSDIRSIWAENHLLVLASRGEGTPLALVEAMLCGRAAVVTDVGGNAEWVNEPLTGFVAEAPTAKSLGAALERAWQAQDKWKQMGIDAHEYATAKFDDSPGERLLEIIMNVINL